MDGEAAKPQPGPKSSVDGGSGVVFCAPASERSERAAFFVQIIAASGSLVTPSGKTVGENRSVSILLGARNIDTMTVLSTADEGKVLMDIEGEEIGVVTEVDTDEQVAYVEPDPSISEAIVQGLGYGDADDDDIEVPAESVETVTDTELRVTVDL
jgi:sporulation protein YlmC with PRC-barrel domain